MVDRAAVLDALRADHVIPTARRTSWRSGSSATSRSPTPRSASRWPSPARRRPPRRPCTAWPREPVGQLPGRGARCRSRWAAGRRRPRPPMPTRPAQGTRTPTVSPRPGATAAAGPHPRRAAHHRGVLGQGRRRQVHGGREPGAGAPADAAPPSASSTPTSTAPTCRSCSARKGKPGMFDNRIIPVEAHGIKMMSIGLLVNEREPLVWRGPMIHSFIQQMLKDVMWGALDYLVFDMPPGTGDAQLSLSQVMPLERRGDGHDAAGRGAARRAQGDRHVPAAQRADPRHRREHELLRAARTAASARASSARPAASGVADEYGVPLLAPAAARSRDARGAATRARRSRVRRPGLGPGGGLPRPGRAPSRRRLDELARARPLPKIG